MRALLTMALVAALAGSARADDGSGLDDHHRGVEGSVGILIGDLPFGSYDGGGIGGSFSVGYKRQRLLAFAEYDLISESGYFGNGERARGYAHRGSANLRYDVLSERFRDQLRLSLWLEAGVGHQYLQWNDGTSIDRPDFSLGFAGAALIGGHGTHYAGYSGGLKPIFARAPDLRGDVRCAGTCTSPQLAWDVGVMYSVTFPFGR